MVADYIGLIRPEYTLEEYYGLLEASDRRWEYWDGELICMAGGSPRHAMISSRLFLTIAKRLEGRSCEVFNSDMAVKTPSLPPFRFPDLSIVCGQPVFEKLGKFEALTNPLVLIEVLSPGTESMDREPKRLAYQGLASVQEYWLVAQNVPHVTLFVRVGNQWQRFEYGALEAVLDSLALQCELPLAEIYRGVEFE